MANLTCVVIENGARCPNAGRRRGMCSKHHARLLRTGDPLTSRVAANGAVRAALEAAARATGDECLFLPGRKPGTRPTYELNGQSMNASRAVWILAHGDPGDLHVLHTCHRGDVGCIMIRHLYLGDHQRNIRDMVEAGRATTATRGEGMGGAKLTREQVVEIRSRYVKRAPYPDPGSSRAIAEEFGISPLYVPMVVARDRWAWMGEESEG